MSMSASSTRRLDIGQALQDVLAVLGGNFRSLALLGLPLAGVPIALANLGNALAVHNSGFVLLTIGGLVGSFVARPILYGAVIFWTVRHLDGETASLAESISAGRRRWGTLLVLMIRSGVLTGLGLVFLIIPGVYIALRWAVAGPVAVMGGLGASDSMKESAKLSDGQRWAMLMLYLIVFAALICVVLLLIAAEGALSLAAPTQLLAILIQPLIDVFIDVTLAVVTAVLYRRLRSEAYGMPSAALAEVFA